MSKTKQKFRVGDAVKWKHDGPIKEVCTVVSICRGFVVVESRVCGGRFGDFQSEFERAR